MNLRKRWVVWYHLAVGREFSLRCLRARGYLWSRIVFCFKLQPLNGIAHSMSSFQWFLTYST
jgi:hypothetical protein